MNKCIWITDIHLDHLSYQEKISYITSIKEKNPQIVICTGDISNAYMLSDDLSLICNILFPIKFCFVLGNHDIYGSSFELVDKKIFELENNHSNLIYLHKNNKIFYLNNNTVLIGFNGWYDTMNGDFYNSNVSLSDWINIFDYNKHKFLNKDSLRNISINRTEENIKNLNSKLEIIKNNSKIKNIIILTHVPPFDESFIPRYENSRIEYYLPFYSNNLIKKKILKFANENINKNIFIFSGHSHRKFVGQNGNVKFFVGYSEYESPIIQDIKINF